MAQIGGSYQGQTKKWYVDISDHKRINTWLIMIWTPDLKKLTKWSGSISVSVVKTEGSYSVNPSCSDRCSSLFSKV